MKHIFFYFITFMLILSSCNKKKIIEEEITTPILSINVNETNLQTDKPALPNLRYIKLETKDECLLEDASKVIYYNNKLYILSTPGKGNVYIFDKEGHFLYKMNKGEGPEDIMYPTDIAINEEEQKLLVLDMYRNIKEYDLEKGTFLNKKVIKEPFFSIETIGGDILLFDPNSRSKADFYIRYLSKTKETDLFPKKVKGDFFSLPNFFTKISAKETLVSCIFSDTIFYINDTDKKLLPYLILDFQKKSANSHKSRDEIRGLGQYINNAKENNLLTGPCDLCFFNNNLFFTLKGKTNYFTTYNTDKQQILLHKTLFEGLPNIYSSVGRTNEEVIFSIDMPWLLEHFKENPISNSPIIKKLNQECTNENENPVILFGSF